MIHVPGGKEQDRVRFYHATQSGTQLKMCELYVSVVLHLILWNYGWPWIAETMESETVNGAGGGIPVLSLRTVRDERTKNERSHTLKCVHN